MSETADREIAHDPAEHHRAEREETITSVFRAIEKYTTDCDGAPAGDVIDAVLDDVDYSLLFVIETLYLLKARGEIYEPKPGNLKSINGGDHGGQ